MKSYMNEKEKDNHLFMCHLKPIFDEVINSSFYTPEELTNFKKARTYLRKALESVMFRIDKKYAQQINRINKECNLYLIPETRLKAISMKDGYLTVSDKDYYKLVENASAECRGCERECDYTKCVNYSSMLSLGVPFVYKNTPDGICPFKKEKYTNENRDYDYEYKRMLELEEKE